MHTSVPRRLEILSEKSDEKSDNGSTNRLRLFDKPSDSEEDNPVTPELKLNPIRKQTNSTIHNVGKENQQQRKKSSGARIDFMHPMSIASSDAEDS
mmetsp:Transcript_1652/g.2159  ORF Transcript_1652/g.2159 Transcript_1652/m.2159 type:complete len:96 (-) Transcript_1652:20-307(-)